MIKVDMKNKSTIIERHYKYFEEYVIPMIKKEIEKQSIASLILDKMFIVDGKINYDIVRDLCYGEQDVLIAFIDKYNEIYSASVFPLIKDIRNYDRCLRKGNVKKESIKKRTLKIRQFIEKIDESSWKSDSNAIVLKNRLKKLKDFSKEEIENLVKDLVTLEEIWAKIFNYDEFSKNKLWNRHKLISLCGISVCPYCNRQYISSYDGELSTKTTADLDHYYSQKKYPFLALSLYNFVPSCQICNSRFKGSYDFYETPHIYPYKDEFGDMAIFRTSFFTGDEECNCVQYDINYLLGMSENFKIDLLINEEAIIEELKTQNIKESELNKACKQYKKKIWNSIERFHIEQLYQTHKGYIREIIRKSLIYNQERIDEIFYEYPELFETREELLSTLFSNYSDLDTFPTKPI